MDAVLYIHGKGGSADECERYRPLFPDSDVIGLDYKTFSPKETGEEIHGAVIKLKKEYENVILISNSIGAFFSMNADIVHLIQKAYFISPIVDMERLILDMMARANVTEADLQKHKVIKTGFGEDLSWDYLRYVREHPVSWDVPTHVIYGENDALTRYDTVYGFASRHSASLSVMKGGEHWFHTEEQMRFIDEVIKRKERCTVFTDRLKIYPASEGQMKELIEKSSDDLKPAYTEMLALSMDHPDKREWYAAWMIELRNGAHIGDLCFKGLDENGMTEIGYGICEEYRGKGYATEAADAVVSLAFEDPRVTAIEAETEPSNEASRRVLEKCGFIPTGKTGEEGPRFILRKPKEFNKMKNNIAYCGLDCEKCDAYIAALNNDDELRAKTAKLWSELNNVTITPEMINCSGCRAEGVKTPYCESLCPIRICGLEKGLETCGGCENLSSCEKVGMIIKNNAQALENLKRVSDEK